MKGRTVYNSNPVPGHVGAPRLPPLFLHCDPYPRESLLQVGQSSEAPGPHTMAPRGLRSEESGDAEGL